MPMASTLCLYRDTPANTLWVFVTWTWNTNPPHAVLPLTPLIDQVQGSLTIWIFDSETGKFQFLFL